MLLYKLIYLGFCLLVPFALAMGFHAQAENVLVISLRADRTEIQIGEQLILEELVVKGTAKNVGAMNHRVLRIGEYDTDLGRIVNRDSDRFYGISPRAFKGLASNLVSSHPRPFNLDKLTEVGFKEVVEPQTLGIFLITAEWLAHYNGKSAWIASNPIVVVVKPPLGGDGKPLIKAEWLKDPPK